MQKVFIARKSPFSSPPLLVVSPRCPQLARVLSRRPLIATALPARRAAVGTVRVAPVAVVKTRPPAAVKAVAVIGSKVGVGAAMEGARRARQAKKIKPITFMIKLLECARLPM